MRIKFVRINIHNFLSIADESVNLEDMGFTIVTGINNRKTDNASSNGSGKSSIFNAIFYVLTGETAQGVSNNIENIFSNPDDCWVEIELYVDSDKFVIKRIKSPRPDLKISINDNDVSGKGIKESSKILQDYLPDITAMFLSNVIILGQGLPNKFTDGTPSMRKDKLERLTKSDFIIQTIRDKLDRRLLELKTSLRLAEDEKVANRSKYTVYENQLAKAVQELHSMEDATPADLPAINKLESELKKKEQSLNEDLAKLSVSISEKQQEQRTILEQWVLDNYDEYLGIVPKFNEACSKYNTLLGELKSIENQYKKYSKFPRGVCPTCGQPVKDLDVITSLEAELKAKKDEVSKSKAENLRIEQEKKAIEQEFNKKRSEASNQSAHELNELLNENKSKTAELSEIRKSLNNIYADKLAIENFNTKKANLEKTVNEYQEELSKLDSSYLEIDKSITKYNAHIRVIQNMITLTKREFRCVLLENVIKYIDTKAKIYSKYVFDTDLLTFELNENYIDIKYDGKYYEALSGGEKQKVDIIIQLAIRDLLSTQLGVRSSLICFDEVFDNLDAHGCQKIIDLISKMKDIESVFIISHHAAELQISYDNHIEVEKSEAGISKITLY